MKTFGATFLGTLAAILVAAVLIGSFIEIKSRREALAKAEAETAALKAETARREKEEKEAADFRKAHGLPETLEERIHRKLEEKLGEKHKSPTPQP